MGKTKLAILHMPINIEFWVFTLVVLAVASTLTILGIFNAVEIEKENIERDLQRIELIQLRYDRQTLDLALEFGFDPMIVQVARKVALNAFNANKCECSTWRFITTDRELVYLLLSIIQIESGGHLAAVGDGGKAHSLTQIWLATAQIYKRSITSQELMTIEGNLLVSVDHLVDLLQQFHGNHYAAVTAWNRGAGAVRRDMAFGVFPGNGYALKVFTQAAWRNAR